MKKYSILAILFLAACAQEPMAPEEPAAELIRFEAEILAPEAPAAPAEAPDATKTALGAKVGTSYPNYWAAGDAISVNGAASTALNYEAEMAKADVSELEKIMMELQRRLDESEEELNALLEAIQNGLDAIAQLLASATDTQTEIASQIGQMA